MNRYRFDIIFKKKNLVFFNNKNIVIKRLFKKFNNKKFKFFKIKDVIKTLYRF